VHFQDRERENALLGEAPQGVAHERRNTTPFRARRQRGRFGVSTGHGRFRLSRSEHLPTCSAVMPNWPDRLI